MFSIGCLEIIPADIKEEYFPTLPVGEAAAQIALSKAVSVAEKVGNRDIILAADTLVSLDNHILGKPVDASDAARMLNMLSQRTHMVCTGIALIHNGRQLCRYETTFVTFKQLTEAEICAYIASGEPVDKAGAYGAQGLASLFIRRIEGDFFNVVGLPLCLLGSMLSEMGFSLF
jgi:septum formation protein